MKENKVISRKNLPTQLPIGTTILLLVTLDHFNAPDWLGGFVICFLTIGWIVSIIAISNEKHKDIFEDDKN